MRKIENLVFKGGGVLGIAYAGAIQALHEADLLEDIKAWLELQRVPSSLLY